MMAKLIGVAVPNSHISHIKKGVLRNQEQQNSAQEFLKSLGRNLCVGVQKSES